MVLVHAVHTKVLSGPFPHMKDWISAISQILENHHDIVQDKVCIIGAEVKVIVHEVQERNVIRNWKIVSKWKFSDREAEIFSSKLNKCVTDNLM